MQAEENRDVSEKPADNRYVEKLQRNKERAP